MIKAIRAVNGIAVKGQKIAVQYALNQESKRQVAMYITAKRYLLNILDWEWDDSFELGLAICKSEESFEDKAYPCSANVPTIGFGSTYYLDKTPVKLEDVITLDKADKLIRLNFAEFVEHVNDCTQDLNLTVLQKAVLYSFCYNIGKTAFANSTLLKYLKAGKPKADIIAQIKRWNKGGPGLTARRERETFLFAL
jgi:lysozyme